MKAVKILKIVINILFVTFITLFVLGVLFVIASFIFEESFGLLAAYKMIFYFPLKWYFYLGLIFSILSYILFTISIYYLKKCIKFFEKSDFYSDTVIRNLKRVGFIYIFISVGLITVRLISLIFNQAFNFPIESINAYLVFIYVQKIISIFEIKSLLLLVLGLFFLTFSKGFENAKFLQQENELTI